MDFTVYKSENIDIHHIFPRHWCEKNHIPREDYDTIVNKTPLSKGTNIFVGGEAPSKYLVRLEKRAEASTDEINDLLCTHLVNPEIIRTDDFYAFLADRKEQILRRIEQATGKPIVRDTAINSDEGVFAEDDFTEEE